MDLLFISIYRFFKKRRGVYISLLVLLMLFIGWNLRSIRLDDDIKKVVPHSKELAETQELLDNLKVLDKLVVVFEAKDSTSTEDLIQLVDSFVLELDSQKIENISQVRYRIKQDMMQGLYDFFHQNLPLFLTEDDYTQIEKSLQNSAIDRTIESNYKSLLSPAGFALKKYIIKDPLSWTPLALKHLQEFKVGGDFIIYQQRIFSADKKNLFVFVNTNAKDQKSNQRIVDFVEEFENTKLDSSNINLHYFGASPVAFANQSQIKKDIFLTVGIAFLLVIVFISFFFKSWKVFVNILMPVVLGSGLSLSILILIKGEISALALAVGSVLLGITIDYALHIYAHLRENSSIQSVIKSVAAPILLSSLTTGIAFVLLIGIESEAFTDLAIFASLSVLFVAIFALIIVPQQVGVSTEKKSESFLTKLLDYKILSRGYLLAFVLLLSVFMYFGVSKVKFEGDLLKLNFLSEQLKKDQVYIDALTVSGRKDIYLSAKGEDLEDALVNNEKAKAILEDLKRNRKILSYSSVSDLWPSKVQQKEKIKRWNRFWEEHSKDSLKYQMQISGEKLNFNTKAFSSFFTWLNRDFSPIEHQKFEKLRTLIFDDFISESEQTHVLTIVKMDNPSSEEIANFYSKFDSQAQIYPFDKQHFSEILLDGLKTNFSKLVWWSILAVFIVLLLYYGRIELTIINLAPILISWLWTLGMAGWLGIEFNIFNIIISSLIFGLGIDYSIAITQGLIRENKYGTKELQSFKISVFFSAITTLAGVGVMIFAKHPALKSMAIITVLGITSVLFLSFTLIPILFNFLIKTKKGKRKQPVNLLSFTLGNLSQVLVWLSMLVSIVFTSVLSILPIPKKTKKLIYSHFLQKASWLVVYMNFNMPKKIINQYGEDFKKPVFIIANHQSQLDLVFMLMLYPKMIVVTNRSVWNNPVLRFFVRYADFYPVLDGMKDAKEKLQYKIDNGYSVLVFPEGTRTKDGKIKRFHKGVFQLALDMKMEILPIIIHGAYDSLSRHEFFLHKSNVYFKILERIDISEAKWGDSLKEKTKAVQDYFRAEFEQLKTDVVPTKYWRKYVLSQYIYKGPIVEWYAKIKTRMEDNYQMFDNLIPKDAKLVDIGCGYGFLPHYLALTSEYRTVIGYDYDKEKIAVAAKVTETLSNLHFDYLDITQGLEEKADAFVIADVLHYMPEDMQEQAVRTCYQNLNKGGVIIIRDANAEMEKKHQKTKITEFLSTKVFRFNKTQDESKQLYFITKERLLGFLKNEAVEVEILDNTKYLSNLVYLIRKKDE